MLALDTDAEPVLEVDPLYSGLTKVPSLDLAPDLDLHDPDLLDETTLGLLELCDTLLELDLGIGDDPLTEAPDTDPLADPPLSSRETEALLEELLGGVLLIGGVLGGVLLLDKPPADLLDEDLDPEL